MIDFSKIYYNLALVLLTVAFFSCENHVIEEEEKEIFNCDTTTSFATSIKPIIDQECIRCHDGTIQNPDLRTYNGVSSNANSVQAEVTSRRMPQGRTLTDEQIALIDCWITSGALDN